MAATISPGGNIIVLAAANDTTATLFGTGHRIRVATIIAVSTGTSGACVVKCGGASGTTVYSGTPADSSSTTIYSPAQPVELNDIIATTLDADVAIHIHFV